MAKLTAIAMQNEVFRKVVNTQKLETEIRRISNITDILRGIEPGDVERMAQLPKSEQKKLKDKLSMELFYEYYMQYLDRYNHSNKGQRA